MSDTFKFLNNGQGGAAQDFLKEKMSKNKYADVSDPSNPYSMGEGTTPGGDAYPQTIVPGTEKYTPNSRDYGSDLWSHSTEGQVGFQDSWDASNYAQQIKASGPVNAEYDEKFAALSKGDSAVDDDGEWKTLKSQKNSNPQTKAEFEALSQEWKDAGYDERVQDLDNSAETAT